MIVFLFQKTKEKSGEKLTEMKEKGGLKRRDKKKMKINNHSEMWRI